jgi:hypothetical protein
LSEASGPLTKGLTAPVGPVAPRMRAIMRLDSQIPRSTSAMRAGRVVVVASVVVDGAASSPPLHPSGYSQP